MGFVCCTYPSGGYCYPAKFSLQSSIKNVNTSYMEVLLEGCTAVEHAFHSSKPTIMPSIYDIEFYYVQWVLS